MNEEWLIRFELKNTSFWGERANKNFYKLQQRKMFQTTFARASFEQTKPAHFTSQNQNHFIQ